MLAMLVLFVLIMIVFQISMTAGTDRRVASNDLYLTKIDRAIESAMLKVFEDLKEDAAAGAEADASASSGGGLPGVGGASGDAGAGAPAGATDSKEDSWGRAQQTEINGISLRILVQDEDSKLNVLTMLTEDDDEAEKAFQRVVRVLDLCRETTEQDIDEGTAREMAEAMLEFLQNRDSATIPQPSLLTDEDESSEGAMPLSLREFLVLDPFEEKHFRDYRDAEGVVVHSIASFLTVSTSLTTYEEFRTDLEEKSKTTGAAVGNADSGGTGSGGSSTGSTAGSGSTAASGASNAGGSDVPSLGPGDAGGGLSNGVAGVAVNVNTAPSAVLHALMDRNEISWPFLDEILVYRNEEEEEDASEEDVDPVYDEYGQEVIVRQIFDSLDELKEVDSWDSNEPGYRDEFLSHLTVESGVFSIYITGRFSTRANGAEDSYGMSREEREAAEELGTDLTRTVRCTVWRYKDGEEYVLVPLERWEVLDYRPFEVLDFPDEER